MHLDDALAEAALVLDGFSLWHYKIVLSGYVKLSKVFLSYYYVSWRK